MSSLKTTNVACPKCKTEGKYTKWDSINVTLDPTLKDKILSRELFQWKCPNCEEIFQLDYAFLYHDMDKKLMINYFPIEEDEKTSKTKEVVIPELFTNNNYTYRSIFGFDSLIEKILIWENELDDSAIEVFKQMLYVSLNEHEDKFKGKDFYLRFASKVGNKLAFIAFIDGQPEREVSVSKDRYDQMLAILKEHKLLDVAGMQWQVIDSKWAIETIRKLKK